MPLKSLRITNFTAFSDVDIKFSPGLNVIIGENASGKSHLLKLGYALAWVLYDATRPDRDMVKQAFAGLSKSSLQRSIADKLLGVFKPDTLGRLCRRGMARGKSHIVADFGHIPKLEFSFASNSQRDVKLTHVPHSVPYDVSVFLPPREVLSFYPELISLYEQRELAMDETYYDLCKLLNLPLLKGKRAREITEIVKPLEDLMGGSVKVSSGRFYLHIPGQAHLEMPLVAEGWRKVAMLSYLAANGSLSDKSVLFWDEPEANLNPRIMALMAETLTQLVRTGVQVILATHSLFVMKELSLLVEQSGKTIPARFFALRSEGREVTVEDGELLEDLQTIVSLDEVLRQDDREQEFFLQEMR